MALCAASGCASAGKSAVDAWADHNGSVVAPPADERTSRLDAALASLSRPDLSAAVSVRVLGTDDLGAYAWPNGQVFVTRGLLDLLDDRELAAALAHELGHLIGDGHTGRPAALKGSIVRRAAGPDAEEAADRAALDLLRAAAIEPAVLTSVLAKLAADPRTPAGVRDNLRHRIALLAACRP